LLVDVRKKTAAVDAAVFSCTLFNELFNPPELPICVADFNLFYEGPSSYTIIPIIRLHIDKLIIFTIQQTAYNPMLSHITTNLL
jgi:hypothetical protein